jgi:hypothetical protein
MGQREKGKGKAVDVAMDRGEAGVSDRTGRGVDVRAVRRRGEGGMDGDEDEEMSGSEAEEGREGGREGEREADDDNYEDAVADAAGAGSGAGMEGKRPVNENLACRYLAAQCLVSLYPAFDTPIMVIPRYGALARIASKPEAGRYASHRLERQAERTMHEEQLLRWSSL